VMDSHKEEGAKAVFGYLSRGRPKFLVTPLLMGPVCLLSQGRFEEPVQPCSYGSHASYRMINE